MPSKIGLRSGIKSTSQKLGRALCYAQLLRNLVSISIFLELHAAPEGMIVPVTGKRKIDIIVEWILQGKIYRARLEFMIQGTEAPAKYTPASV
jgi:hypothetical protein